MFSEERAGFAVTVFCPPAKCQELAHTAPAALSLAGVGARAVGFPLGSVCVRAGPAPSHCSGTALAAVAGDAPLSQLSLVAFALNFSLAWLPVGFKTAGLPFL